MGFCQEDVECTIVAGDGMVDKHVDESVQAFPPLFQEVCVGYNVSRHLPTRNGRLTTDLFRR